MHPADQSITCKACGDLFVRAGHLVAHYEFGYCKEITSTQFRQQVQARTIQRVIMAHLDHFSRFLGPQEYEPSLAGSKPELQDGQEGGVHLLDHEYEGQHGGYKPLQAEVDLISVHESQPTRSETETWPRLPVSKSSQLTSSMASISIGSRTPSISSAGISASAFAREITRRSNLQRAHDEAFPFLKSPAPGSSISNEDDNVSEGTTTIGSPTTRSVAWTTSNTSQALFKDAKPHPAAGDWAGITKYRQEIATQRTEADESLNILTARWWDPQHGDYSAQRFRSAVTGKYICPFPDCEGEYDITQDVADHLTTTHMRTDFRCPLCLKIFKSASALVSHCESAGKCRVKDGNNFKSLLDEISGGFLEGEHLSVPKIYTPQTALVKAGEATNGLMPVRYKAKLPHERKA